MAVSGGSVTLTEEIQLLTNDICQNGQLPNETNAKCTLTTVSLKWTHLQKVRVVVSLVGKIVVPAVAGVYCAYLKGKGTLISTLGGKLLPAVVAFIAAALGASLRSIQATVLTKIVILLQNTKNHIQKPLTYEFTEPKLNQNPQKEPEPEKSVTCTVLSEPPQGLPIIADVIFIHGLHGSIVKTWKQGQWKMPKCLTLNPSDKNASNLSETKTSGLKRRISVSSDTFLKSKSPKKNLEQKSRRYSTIPPSSASSSSGDDCEESDCENNCEKEKEDSIFEEDSNEPYTECWPRDWLPKDCPGVRVIAVTYTTDPYLWRPVWIKEKSRTSLEQRSDEMTEQLLQLGVGKNPIIWVGHSKGGLFVKQLLVNAWERSHDSRLSEIYQNTKAIMFYSVPHRGSKLADFSLPLVRKSVELLEIQKDCDKVLNLHQKFLSVCNDEKFKPQIFSFIETSYTFMTFLYLRIVAIESADPGIGQTVGVPLDHREICKPRGRDCFLYKQLIHLIDQVTIDQNLEIDSREKIKFFEDQS